MNIFKNRPYYIFFAILITLWMAFFNCLLLQASAQGSMISSKSIHNSRYSDTSIIKSDTLKSKSKDIYQKIEHSANKNYITRKLYGLFFRRQNIEEAGKVYNKTNAVDKFAPFNGKVINRIDYVGLKVFGQSIGDTVLKQTSLLESAANRIHIKTAKSMISNSILFKSGDVVSPIDFAESEQLIRSHDYIEDASIVIESLDDTTMVNVTIITKDAWSIGVDYRYGNQYSSQLQLYDKNFAGYGVYLSGDLFYDSRESNLFGRKYEVGVSNIGGSFVDANISERLGQGYKSYTFDLKRDFFASKTHYGGGLGYVNSCEPYRFKTLDTTREVCYKVNDYWLGRSFRLSRKEALKTPLNFVLAFRFIDRNFTTRPLVSPTSNYYFHNRKYYLAGIGISKQDLFRANLIYSQGSTEDIPTGYRVQFTAGVEKDEFKNRYYLGNEFSAAEMSPWGYFFTSVRGGGFIAEEQQFQQVTVNLRSTYFSNLISLSNLKLRQFVRIDFTRGISRFYGVGEEGESIFLDENYGVRGLSSRDMRGTSRMIVNLETVAFSPLYLYGFRFAFYGFYDFGIIGDARESIIGNQSFSGFGLGVRIRNENLVLNSISIRLGYYPKLPINADVTYWLITGQQRTRFENFRAKPPQILPFE